MASVDLRRGAERSNSREIVTITTLSYIGAHVPYFNGFNPFNPFHVMEMWRNPPPVYPHQARTADVFGRTNFTEKNSRAFGIDTAPGWSAAACAKRLADKVNAEDDFRAKVTVDGDSATIHFERR